MAALKTPGDIMFSDTSVTTSADFRRTRIFLAGFRFRGVSKTGPHNV